MCLWGHSGHVPAGCHFPFKVGNFGFPLLLVNCGDCSTLLEPWVECGPWREISAPISSFPHLQPAHERCCPVEMGQAMSSFSFPYSPPKDAEHGPPPPALAQGLAVGQSTAHHPSKALAPSWGL